MARVEYRCRHCGAATRQQPGLDVGHWCPRQRGRLVPMTPATDDDEDEKP